MSDTPSTGEVFSPLDEAVQISHLATDLLGQSRHRLHDRGSHSAIACVLLRCLLLPLLVRSCYLRGQLATRSRLDCPFVLI